MNQRRIVTIQDISCFGKCSLTVALPVVSAMGVETVIIPTAVLSTHTGGFKDYTFRDLTEDIPKIAHHWKTLDLKFDLIYTGYLGSFEQLSYINNFFDEFKTEDNLIIIDPAMGDKGKLYVGFTHDFAIAMGKLCARADVIIPNLTEAAFMLGEEYIEQGYDETYIHGLLKKLCDLGAKSAILTGISYQPDKIGAVCYDSRTGEFHSYFNERIGEMFHGTGDIFASTCAGAIARDFSLGGAMELAVDFVLECIRATDRTDKERMYGVNFEECIPYLVKRIDIDANKNGKLLESRKV